MKACITVIKHVNDNRQVHTPYNQRVRFCQHFEIIVLEKSRLPLIIYFFKMHATKIGKLDIDGG
jgi:hypothetical protein